MSTLKIDNIENLAGTRSTSSDNIIAGCAKAWVNFNSTGTVAIRDSFNVSSITDTGTGDYTVNFTVAMSSANYAVSGSAAATTGDAGNYFTAGNGTLLSTSSARIKIFNSTPAAVDRDQVLAAMFSN